MCSPNDMININNNPILSNKKAKKLVEKESNEKENMKNEDTTTSTLSSNKKTCIKKENKSLLNYSINNNPIRDKENKEKQKQLYSIKEEKINKIKDKNSDEDESFYLLEENKNNKIEKNEEETNKLENIDSMDKILDYINNKKKKSKSKKKYKKEKENEKEAEKEKEKEVVETINLSDEKEEEVIDLSDENDIDIKKVKKSKITSKNEIDLELLNKEEKEPENENDFKSYIQKPSDEEKEYKIIYEFNKLPFKPKTISIDLSIFDINSLFNCISYCFYDKKEQRFILNLNFVYLSDKSQLYKDKKSDKIILNYFSEKKKNKDEENNTKKNSEKENEYNIDNEIKITVTLKRFKISKERDTIIGREKKTINKKDEFDGFDELKFEEKEDLINYSNYHKIFYILSIQKNILLVSKKSLPGKKLGIHNEGNTCYMNSIIQSIYNNPFLLKNIMAINIDSEILNRNENEKHRNIIYSLQSIFYKLYKNRTSIKISEIFYSFEWNKSFWNSPQDAEEIYMEIYEIISLYNKEIKDNCEGILENNIEVNKINYKSMNEENFFFLQLDIENNKTLDECLEHFFKEEELTGDNKYQYIDRFNNKQLYDATKFYKFKKIPNILFIQLKRFKYDLESNNFNKINNGISFKEEIDLSDYLDSRKSSKKRKAKEEYILYCIIIHSGTADNGHYFCFAKDFKHNCYIKFNDTSVYVAEKKEVFKESFGGEELEYAIIKNKDKTKYEIKDMRKEISKNAYIFIYIKKDKIDDIFSYHNIKELFEAFLKKKQEEELKEKEREKEQEKKEMNKTIEGFLIPRAKDYRIKNRKTISHQNYNFNPKYSKDQIIKLQENRKTNNNINMKEEFDFGNILNEMDNANRVGFESVHKFGKKNKENKTNNYPDILSKKKRNTTYYKEVIQNKSINSYNYNKPMNTKKVSEMEYTPYTLFNENNFYLIDIDNLSNKIKGKLIIEYNKKIKVKDIPAIIKNQLNVLQKSNIEIFEKIINSKGYKLALVNCFGYFIKFLDDGNDDITNLLDKNKNKNLKHLCLYDLKISKEEDLSNIISVNFISKNILNLILCRSADVYHNYNYENVNVPAFLINEKINSLEVLENKIKDIYINYFGSQAEKNKKFKIYIIKENDILNLDPIRMNYIELDQTLFAMYIDVNTNSYRRLIIEY